MHLQRLLLEFLPSLVQNARRLIKFFRYVRIVFELELGNVRVSLLDQIYLVVWGRALVGA